MVKEIIAIGIIFKYFYFTYYYFFNVKVNGKVI